jgi:hypothetical protein
MKRIALLLLAVLGLYCLYHIGLGFMDAAKHGGSPAARERRLIAVSRQQNVGLPKKYGEGTVMLTTKAGPGLRFTYVFQLVNLTSTKVNTAALAAEAKNKLIQIYKTNPETANFRKWEVELCCQFIDKDGSEITTVAVAAKDL